MEDVQIAIKVSFFDVKDFFPLKVLLFLGCLYANLTQIYTEPFNMLRRSNVKSHTISTACTTALKICIIKE